MGAYASTFLITSPTQPDQDLLCINGRYYDPATGRYLTPDNWFDPYRPGTLNPYAPLQGPGLWLFVPVLGLVLLRKRRGGPWRVMVLVCVVGVGMSLVSCGAIETPAPGPTQLPLPQPPTLPISTPTETPTNTPTLTPLPPTATPTLTPSPSPSPTVTPTPTPCPTPSPWQSLGIYFITVYYHSSAQVWIDSSNSLTGQMIDVPIDVRGTSVTIKAKSGWVESVNDQGVAGWVERSVFEASGVTEYIAWDNEPEGGEGVFVRCASDATCYREVQSTAKTGASGDILEPYQHVAFNPTYNNSLQLGDHVQIEELGEKVVKDTGGGIGTRYDSTLPEDAWLDYYLGIQAPEELFQFSIGRREVKKFVR